MGVMMCKTHGRVNFVETCSHIAKQIGSQHPHAGGVSRLLDTCLFARPVSYLSDLIASTTWTVFPRKSWLTSMTFIGKRLKRPTMLSKIGKHSA